MTPNSTSAGSSCPYSVASSTAIRPRSRGSSPARAPSTWIASATATARSGSASGRGQDRREQVQTERGVGVHRSEEHTSELQSPDHLVCRLLLAKKKMIHIY